MRYFQVGKDQHLICLRNKYSWDFFAKRIKIIPGTYSEAFAKKLYLSVFDTALDVNQEYSKYYRDEYENVHKFMFWKYGVSEEICRQLPDAAQQYLAIFETEWQIEDDQTLKDSFVSIFNEVDK